MEHTFRTGTSLGMCAVWLPQPALRCLALCLVIPGAGSLLFPSFFTSSDQTECFLLLSLSLHLKGAAVPGLHGVMPNGSGSVPSGDCSYKAPSEGAVPSPARSGVSSELSSWPAVCCPWE